MDSRKDYPLPPYVYERREPVGELRLEVAQDGKRSYAASQFHQGALKIMRPHYIDNSGQVYYTILNQGGGYLGGDDYRMKIAVHKDASLLLTGQSATKVYRTPDNYALQDMDVILEEGAVFEYIPDQLILYRESTYSQYMNVSMDSTASFLTAEIVTPGWAPDGSIFGYDEVRMRTAINVDGELAVIDNLLIRPQDPHLGAESMLFFDDMSHLATLLAVDHRIDDQVVNDVRDRVDKFVEEKTSSRISWAVTRTAGHGMALRALGTYTEDLFKMCLDVADYLRGLWRGQKPINLRKY